MQFTSFDRSNVLQLCDELDAVLAKFGIQENLKITVGNLRFSTNEVKIEVLASISGKTTISETIIDREINRLGLTKVNTHGDTLVEYISKNWKMPYVYETRAGKRFKCDETQAVRLFTPAGKVTK